MSLEGNNFNRWNQMKQTFMDNCKARDIRDEILRMIQGENESLEDYEVRFHISWRDLLARV
jgi:hypothetical protein